MAVIKGPLLMITVVCLFTFCQALELAMDKRSTCDGVKRKVGRTAVIVRGKSKITTPNQIRQCILTLEADYQQGTQNRMEITIENINIRDCNVKLSIYDNVQAIGKTLRVLGCSSSSTGVIYSKGHIVTLKYIRPINLYETNDFKLSFTAFSDTEGTSQVLGPTRLKSWMIVVIVIGIVIFLGALIFLLIMFSRGRLPGMSGPPSRMRKERILRTDTKTPAASEPRQTGRAAVYHAAPKSDNYGARQPFSEPTVVLPYDKRNQQISSYVDKPNKILSNDAVGRNQYLNQTGNYPSRVAVLPASMKNESGSNSTVSKDVDKGTFFKNPDAEGYIYSYDHLYPDNRLAEGDSLSNNSEISQGKIIKQNIQNGKIQLNSHNEVAETNVDDIENEEFAISNNKQDTRSISTGPDLEGRHTPDYYASIDKLHDPQEPHLISNPVHGGDFPLKSKVQSREDLDEENTQRDANYHSDRLPPTSNGKKFYFPTPDNAGDNKQRNDHNPAVAAILSRSTVNEKPDKPPNRSTVNNSAPATGKAALFMHSNPADKPRTENTQPSMIDPPNKTKTPASFSVFQPPPSHRDYRPEHREPFQHRASPDATQAPLSNIPAIQRSGMDPRTGNSVSQAIWAEDYRDPYSVNPDVRQSDAYRVTTNAGPAPIVRPKPFSNQREMLVENARHDPAALMYGDHMSTAPFATNPQSVMRTQPVIRDAPKKSSQIRDKISLSDI